MLISKNKDYYDWIFHTYNDPKIIFKREERTIKEDKSELRKFFGDYKNPGILSSIGYIENDKLKELHNDYFVLSKYKFGFDIPVFLSPLIIGNKVIRRYVYSYPVKDQFMLTFKHRFLNCDELKELNIKDKHSDSVLDEFLKHIRSKFDDEIILLRNNHDISYDINPILNDIGLSEETLSSSEIYNEISLFIAQKNNPETVVINNDIDKRDSKGFDNMSFKRRNS